MAKTPTSPDIEGPFYKPGAPEKNSLYIPSSGSEPLFIQGSVVSTTDEPLPACVELWHADQDGKYDNIGYCYRGKTQCDNGLFSFFSIVPGRYLNGKQWRPAHLHFRVVAEGYEELITQLYFNDDPYNDVDPWFDISRSVGFTKFGGIRGIEYEFVLKGM